MYLSANSNWRMRCYLRCQEEFIEWGYLRPHQGHCMRHSLHHDDVIKWKHFPRYWPFVQGIHRSPQKPVTQSFGVFFDLRLNKRLSKQSGWWFGTPSRPLIDKWAISEKPTCWTILLRFSEISKPRERNVEFWYRSEIWYVSHSTAEKRLLNIKGMQTI